MPQTCSFASAPNRDLKRSAKELKAEAPNINHSQKAHVRLGVEPEPRHRRASMFLSALLQDMLTSKQACIYIVKSEHAVR